MTLIQTASAGENLFFFLVMGVILLFKIIKAVQNQQQRPDSDLDAAGGTADDDWNDWELPTTAGTPDAPARPLPRPLMPVAKPVPNPPPVPARARTETRFKSIRTVTPDASRQQAAIRQYINIDVPAKSATPEPPKATAMDEVRTLMDDSLDTAFPAPAGIRLLTPGTSNRTVRVQARGRKAVRRAILLSEVIGPPRAFDV